MRPDKRSTTHNPRVTKRRRTTQPEATALTHTDADTHTHTHTQGPLSPDCSPVHDTQSEHDNNSEEPSGATSPSEREELAAISQPEETSETPLDSEPVSDVTESVEPDSNPSSNLTSVESCADNSTAIEPTVHQIEPEVGVHGAPESPESEEKMGSSCSKPKETGDILSEKSRRRLSLARADPITHDANIESRGTTGVLVGTPRNRPKLTDLLKEGDGVRLSIGGAAAHRQQNNFENKDETTIGNQPSRAIESFPIGHVCKKGLKPESPNQDDFFIFIIDHIRLFGVFDGHGPFGEDVSNFVQRRLAKAVWDHPNFTTDIKGTITQAFYETQKGIEAANEAGTFDATLSGCTGTLIVLDMKTNILTAAHVGDSRAVVATRKAGAAYEAVFWTEDHKPTLPLEKARIEAAGGTVKRLQGDIPHRVFLKGKPFPGLAMSRAFGDLVAMSAGVVAVPEIIQVTLTPEDKPLLLLCSDGIWEFIQSQEAVDLVAPLGVQKAQDAAELLAREAWNRWIQTEGDVVDDITAQCVYLYD